MLKWIVSVLLVVGALFAVPSAQAGAPSGNITKAFYVNNPGYGPNVMYVRCIKNNGVGAQVGLTNGQNSALDHGCAYVYQIYIPAYWAVACNGVLKWGASGNNRWQDWPGQNWIACNWY